MQQNNLSLYAWKHECLVLFGLDFSIRASKHKEIKNKKNKSNQRKKGNQK